MSEGRPPRWLDRVNFAYKYLFNTCELPFMAYFELGREPAGRAALALLSFGMDDLIRSYFRPAGLRTRRHGRKGRKNRKLPGIPEVSDIVAEKLPGYEEVKGRKVSDGVRMLWKIDAIGQRALYYWMLADVIGDFAYDWTTAIIKDDRSYCPNTWRRLQETKDYTVLGTGPYYGAINLNNTRYKHGPIERFGPVYTIPEGYYQVVWSATVRSIVIVTWEREVQLRITNTRTGEKEYSSLQVIAEGDEANLVAAMTVYGPASIEISMKSNHGPSRIVEGECFIMGYPEN